MNDALLADLRALACASDDGTEYEHNEGCLGEAECAACWAESIRDLIAKHTPEPDVSERDGPEPVDTATNRCGTCGHHIESHGFFSGCLEDNGDWTQYCTCAHNQKDFS